MGMDKVEYGEGGSGVGADEITPYLAYAMLNEVSMVYHMMSGDSQRRVLRRLEMSGALPVARDTPSYQALLGILWGGGAAQLEYLMQAAAPGGTSGRHGPGESEHDEEEDVKGFGETVAFRAARSEAKAAAAERMESHMAEQDFEARFGGADLESLSSTSQNPFADTFAGNIAAFDEDLERLDGLVAADLAACREELERLELEVRALQNGEALDDLDWESTDEECDEADEVPVAEAKLAREDEGGAKGGDKPKGEDKQLSLPTAAVGADPPSKGARRSEGPHRSARVKRHGHRSGRRQGAQAKAPEAKEVTKRSLLGDLPSLGKQVNEADIKNFLNLKLEMPQRSKMGGRDRAELMAAEKGSIFSPKSGKRVSHGVPEEFACAINGHLMKDPVVTPRGNRFERATILLWLKSQGSVCPITGQPLTVEDVKPDKELKTRIMRHHIQKAVVQQNSGKSSAARAGATGMGDKALFDEMGMDHVLGSSRQNDQAKAAPDPTDLSRANPELAPPAMADDLYEF